MDLSIISLEGEFDLSQRTRLQEAFASAQTSPAVIVDFTNALYIDSTVISCLVELRNARLEQKARLMIAGLSSSHERVFQVTGMSSIFDSAATTGDAVKALELTGAKTEHVVLQAE